MKETFTEFEELQEALKRVNMAEDTMPYVRGRLCESESYNKMQQILASPEMLKSHAYILNLDPEQLEECEIERIDKLWNLGVDRGFIVPDKDEDCDSSEFAVCQNAEDPSCPECKDEEVAVPTVSSVLSSQKVKVPCWTVLYSACDKNGDIKTGECYSNAINTRAAKADCYAKLERCGYSSISILAIEAGDPDSCECDNLADLEKKVKVAQAEADISSAKAVKAQADKEVEMLANEDEEVKENDLLKNKPHNAHIAEGDVEEADHSFDDPNKAHTSDTEEKTHYVDNGDDVEQVVDVAGPTDDEKAASDGDYEKLYAEFLTAADDYMQVLEFNDENSNAAKNAFKEVQAAYEDCYAVVPKEDEKELLSQVASYGFKLTPDNCRITEAACDESIDESGNPYAAGMKTSSIGGVSAVGAKKAPAKKAKETLEEEDDTSDDTSDDASDEGADDKSADDSASEEKTEDTDSDEGEDDADASEDKSSEDADDKADDSSDADSEDEEEKKDSDEASDDDDSESDDSESDESDDKSEEDGEEEKKDDASDANDDSSDDKKEDGEDEEDAESEDEKKDDDDKEDDDSSDSDEDDEEVEKDVKEDLTDEEKAQYKNEYKKVFRDTLMKCKFGDLCFDDLTIAQKVTFFKKLNKAWTKNEPQDFMSEKEIEQLNKVVVKK